MGVGSDEEGLGGPSCRGGVGVPLSDQLDAELVSATEDDCKEELLTGLSSTSVVPQAFYLYKSKLLFIDEVVAQFKLLLLVWANLLTLIKHSVPNNHLYSFFCHIVY